VLGSGGRGGAGIQVVVRLRPMNDKEKKYGTLPVVTASTNDRTVTVVKDKHSRQAKLTYSFDDVFTAFSTQEEVFDRTLRPVIGDVLRGFESTVFAYGQTGTGKTHTMEGDLDDPEIYGIIPRSAAALFETLGGEDYHMFRVTCSYLEIYNEDLCDLLVERDDDDDAGGGGGGGSGGRPGSRSMSRASSTMSNSSASSNRRISSIRGGKSTKLEIMEGKAGPFCRGLSEKEVSSPKDVLDLMNTAQQQRRIGETKMNKQSSRSHCIFTLKVHAKCRVMDGGGTMECNGKLHMVDLAGSECAKSAGSDGGSNRGLERERMNINRSLLTLGRVISMLKAQSEGRTKNNSRIPYRDSKLTRVLQESLGGRCKTVIVATLSPSVTAIEESLSTLNYAQTANGIVNKPVASSYMSINRSTAGSGAPDGVALSSGEGHDYKAVEDWNEMEIRLQYMQAQVEEAQGALARKHVLQQEAEERARNADELRADVETALGEARAELEGAKEKMEEEVEIRAAAESDLNSTKEKLTEETERAENAEGEGRRLGTELDESKSVCASLRDDLKGEIELKEEALGKLRDTRIDLAKTRAVLDATRRTESNLTSEAEKLLGTLRESLEDGDDLHGVILRHRSEDVARRQAARAYHESSAATLDTTLAALSELSSSASTLCRTATERSDNRSSSARRAVEETSDMFASLSAKIGELAMEIHKRAEGDGGIAPTARDAADTNKADVSEMIKIVLDSEEDLCSSFTFLRARLSDHSSELERLWAAHDANGFKALSDLERGVEEARDKIERMAGAANEALAKAKDAQRERRERHSTLLSEWESSSMEQSRAIASTADGGATAASEALGTFAPESRTAHDAADDALANTGTLLDRDGADHVLGIEHLGVSIEERRNETDEERKVLENAREEFVRDVMEGIRSLVDERMGRLSVAQETHFENAKTGHDVLAERNSALRTGAVKILDEARNANVKAVEMTRASRTNDERIGEAVSKSVRTMEELRESAKTHGMETESFARRAERDVEELSKLDDEIGFAASGEGNEDSGVSNDAENEGDTHNRGGGGGGIAGRISSDKSDCLDHLTETVLAKAKDGIEYLTMSGGDIAQHSDARILPECIAALEGMERPRPSVLDRLHSTADDATERLEKNAREVERLASEQTRTSDEMRDSVKRKRDDYEEGIAKQSKIEIDEYRCDVMEEMKEYETSTRRGLSGCSSETTAAKDSAEQFVTETLQAREEVPNAPERKEFPYEEKLSSTPAEETVFETLDLSTIDAAAA